MDLNRKKKTENKLISIVVACALYLEYFGHEHGLPPLPFHLYPWPIGSDIGGHHGGGLTWDEYYRL